MGLETGSNVDDLVVTNPLAGDDQSEGDDHLRLIKTVIKSALNGVDGCVVHIEATASPTANDDVGDNYVVGTLWIERDAGTVWVCTDNTSTAAVWKEIYRAGGTDVAVADGGTGGSDAATARSNLGLVIGTNVQAYNAGLAFLAGLAFTNEATFKAGVNLEIGTDVQAYNSNLTGINQALDTTASPTFVTPSVKNIDETVYALSGTTPAIDPGNGGIQTWTLSGNSTPTDSMADGESVLLLIDDGTAYTITWTSIVDEWIGGSAPTLDTTNTTMIILTKHGTNVIGNYIGVAS